MYRQFIYVFCVTLALGLTLPSTTNAELVGWWRFNEGSGTVANDSSGFGRNGTFFSDPAWVTGYSGGALEFARLLKGLPASRRPLLAEASSCLFACKKDGPDGVWVRGLKQGLPVAALPATRTEEALRVLRVPFPEFGPERTGAPVRAYTRISKTPITLHCPISHPSIVMVMDATLLTTVNVLEGLR